VIEERCPYYHFHEIEMLRKQFLYQGYRAARREAIRPRQGELLFRLTHYFRSQNILQIGVSMGLSTLYLSSYAQGLRCLSLEKEPKNAGIARQVYEKAARTPVDLRVGDYQTTLPEALKELGRVDFVFFNTRREPANLQLFEACLPYVHAGSLFVLEGIKANRTMRELWKTIGRHPEVSVTVDLYSLGIVFFNKKLHKRNYTVYF
jgi:predicted O-methyltransferase YrrM